MPFTKQAIEGFVGEEFGHKQERRSV